MFKQILFILLLLFFSPYSFSDEPKGYPFHSFDEAMQQAKAQSKPIFVYFGRYGCGYCEKTNIEAFSSTEVKQIYTSQYVLAYVDSESGKRLRLPSGERITERELGARYKAFVTPVFSYLSSDGQQVHQIIGVQSTESLIKAHKKAQNVLSQANAQ